MRASVSRFVLFLMTSCTVWGLIACGSLQDVRSFSTPYQQPDSGERARLRVISFDGMVRAVPSSSCVDWRLPGAGVMVATEKGFANRNGESLGMPAGSRPAMASARNVTAVSELYVPAGKPIVLHYLSQGTGFINPSTQGTGKYQCLVSKAFVPVAGEDYEAVFMQVEDRCRFGVTHLAKNGNVGQPTPMELTTALLCSAGNN